MANRKLAVISRGRFPVKAIQEKNSFNPAGTKRKILLEAGRVCIKLAAERIRIVPLRITGSIPVMESAGVGPYSTKYGAKALIR